MTYKELLHHVSIEEVEPHLVNMDPEAKDSLGWYESDKRTLYKIGGNFSSETGTIDD